MCVDVWRRSHTASSKQNKQESRNLQHETNTKHNKQHGNPQATPTPQKQTTTSYLQMTPPFSSHPHCAQWVGIARDSHPPHSTQTDSHPCHPQTTRGTGEQLGDGLLSMLSLDPVCCGVCCIGVCCIGVCCIGVCCIVCVVLNMLVVPHTLVAPSTFHNTFARRSPCPPIMRRSFTATQPASSALASIIPPVCVFVCVNVYVDMSVYDCVYERGNMGVCVCICICMQ